MVGGKTQTLSDYIMNELNLEIEKVLTKELIYNGMNGAIGTADIAMALVYWRAGLVVLEPDEDDIRYVISKGNDLLNDIETIEAYNFDRYEGFALRLNYKKGGFVTVKVRIRAPKTTDEKTRFDRFMQLYDEIYRTIIGKYKEYKKTIDELSSELESMRELLEEGCETE